MTKVTTAKDVHRRTQKLYFNCEKVKEGPLHISDWKLQLKLPETFLLSAPPLPLPLLPLFLLSLSLCSFVFFGGGQQTLSYFSFTKHKVEVQVISIDIQVIEVRKEFGSST